MINIEQSGHHRYALHHLGFRPFFLLAGLYATVSMLIWFGVLHFQLELPGSFALSSMNWHAHEMVFGYAMAAIVGFLLTAIRNWTNIQTLNNAGLILLALCWLIARLAPFIDHPHALTIMALSDGLFTLIVIPALLIPLVTARQRQHYFIVGIVALLCTCNIFFYAVMLLGIVIEPSLLIRLGLYLVIMLILIMARRVVPFFIEKGVDTPVTLTNYRWLDISSLVLLVLFIVSDIFIHSFLATSLLALLLAILHGIRLAGWYNSGIWQKPLLWILYLAYGWICIGFAFIGLGLLDHNLPLFATHAFAYGGVGMMTLGMMARVALGHTGRNVFDPPAILFWVFLLLTIGSVARILMPVFLAEFYSIWLGIAQLCWILAFAIYSWRYVPMLIKARVDGRYG